MPATLKQPNTPRASNSQNTWASAIKGRFAKQGMQIFQYAGFNMYHLTSTLDAWDRLIQPSTQEVVDLIITTFWEMCKEKSGWFIQAYILTIRHVPTHLLSPEQQTKIDEIVAKALNKIKTEIKMIDSLSNLWRMGYRWFSSVNKFLRTTTQSSELKESILSIREVVFIILMNWQRKSHNARQVKQAL